VKNYGYTQDRRRLRSASSTSLDVRRTRLSTIGGRAFPVVATRLWNSLPSHVSAALSSAVVLNHVSSHFLIPLSDSSFICTVPECPTLHYITLHNFLWPLVLVSCIFMWYDTLFNLVFILSVSVSVLYCLSVWRINVGPAYYYELIHSHLHSGHISLVTSTTVNIRSVYSCVWVDYFSNFKEDNGVCRTHCAHVCLPFFVFSFLNEFSKHSVQQ